MKITLITLLLVSLLLIASCASKPFNYDMLDTTGVIVDLQHNSAGTLFMVSPHYGITNHHVVGSNTLFEVHLESMQLGNVVYKNKRHDLALVYIKSEQPYLPLCEEMGDIGQKVYSVGYPYGAFYAVLEGRSMGVLEERIITTVQVRPGMSGGALMAGDNCVIGVNSAYVAPKHKDYKEGDLRNTDSILSSHIPLDILRQFIHDGKIEHMKSR